MRRALVIAIAALELTACHDKQSDTGKAPAAAEVLPGSISDAMIAYDTLKSQPPMAVPTGGDEEPAYGRRRPAMDASDAVASEPPADTPVTPPNGAASDTR